MSNLVRLFTPLIVGYGMAMLCPMKSTEGKELKSTPPSWVFGVIWFLIYAILGLTWMTNCQQSKDKNCLLTDIVYSISVMLLGLWLYLYSCQNNPRAALYTLLAITVSALATVVVSIKHQQWLSAVLLCIYVGWTIFATKLNSDIVNKGT